QCPGQHPPPVHHWHNPDCCRNHHRLRVTMGQQPAIDHPAPLLDPTPAERAEMVAVAAYYLAERRGFAPGGAEADWLRAEAQIERMLAAARGAGIDAGTFRELGMRNALRLWAK
ncbi:DUF2934 domain-containing protein, partial [Thiohalocapsa halophila]